MRFGIIPKNDCERTSLCEAKQGFIERDGDCVETEVVPCRKYINRKPPVISQESSILAARNLFAYHSNERIRKVVMKVT